MFFESLDLLLRDPREVARRCKENDGLRDLALVSFAAILVGGGVFGAVVGSFRDGEQAAYAGIKVPLTFLLALAVSVPAFHAFAGSRELSYRGLLVLALGSAGRACLALGALAPFLWLAIDRGLPYHATAIASAALYAISGLAAIALLARGLGVSRPALLLACLVVFGAASAQSAWVLRPFLGRPSQASIPFVRPPEGSYVAALLMGLASSLDHDRRDDLRGSCESQLGYVDTCGPGQRCTTCPDGTGRRVLD